MGAIDEIFKEYVNMRQNGLDSREALLALGGYINPLPQRAKEQIAGQFRSWEQTKRPTVAKTKSQSIEPPTTDELNKAIQRTTQNQQSQLDAALPGAVTPENHVTWDESPTNPPTEAQDVWVSCSNCGNKNRVRDVFCYSCGQMLDDVADHFDTQHFNSATSELFKDDFFGKNSVMILTVRGGHDDGRFELRPQLHNREVVLGRSAENQTVRPDVDLSHVGAAELGVSRLHLSITYDAENESLQAKDLGSANSTYINSQKLLPTEIRVLRHADEVRLGRLVLRVRFQHPGTPLD